MNHSSIDKPRNKSFTPKQYTENLLEEAYRRRAQRKERKEAKPKKERIKDDYIDDLDHKIVWMKLSTGEVLKGRIHAKRRFNVKLEVQDGYERSFPLGIEDASIIINKGFIVWVVEAKENESK